MLNVTSHFLLQVIKGYCRDQLPFFFIEYIGLTINTGANSCFISINSEMRIDDIREFVDEDKKHSSRVEPCVSLALMQKDLEECLFNTITLHNLLRMTGSNKKFGRRHHSL